MTCFVGTSVVNKYRHHGKVGDDCCGNGLEHFFSFARFKLERGRPHGVSVSVNVTRVLPATRAASCGRRSNSILGCGPNGRRWYDDDDDLASEPRISGGWQTAPLDSHSDLF